MGDAVDVRAAHETELDQLARLWYDGWQDAHTAILPADLARLRTLESFRQRLADALSTVRVMGPPGDPLGLWNRTGIMVKHASALRLTQL